MDTAALSEIDYLYRAILSMGTLAEEAQYKAMTALTEGDDRLAAQIIEEDKTIDSFRADIEDRVIRVITAGSYETEQVRVLVGCIKLASDIERIGDHARHLAESVKTVSRAAVEQALPLIQQMSDIGIRMLHDVLTAFVDGDPALAETVARQDDRLDRLHTAARAEILAFMRENPANIPDGISLLFLYRFLERLGDHVTNMCEWVVYAKHGTHIELNG